MDLEAEKVCIGALDDFSQDLDSLGGRIEGAGVDRQSVEHCLEFVRVLEHAVGGNATVLVRLQCQSALQNRSNVPAHKEERTGHSF